MPRNIVERQNQEGLRVLPLNAELQRQLNFLGREKASRTPARQKIGSFSDDS
jgi:hypothetical protein